MRLAPPEPAASQSRGSASLSIKLEEGIVSAVKEEGGGEVDDKDRIREMIMKGAPRASCRRILKSEPGYGFELLFLQTHGVLWGRPWRRRRWTEGLSRWD